MIRRALPFVLAACGTTTTPAQDPPPTWGVPISGGTVIVTRTGDRAIIADPDRDRIVELDLANGTSTVLALQTNDEPGRLVEDAAGRVHVALRRGGALVTIQNDAIIARRAACAEPRGVAYDAATDSVHVACATGELVTFPAAGGDATRVVRVDRDLRDVLVVNGQLYVTRFRTAEVLALDPQGAITSRIAPPVVKRQVFDTVGPGPGPGSGAGSGSGSDNHVDAVAAVAWRTIALPDGRLLVSHQRQVKKILSVVHGGYGGQDCTGSPVEDAVTIVQPGQPPQPIAPFITGALPVDIAVSPDGSEVALVLAGAGVHREALVGFKPDDHDECQFGQQPAQVDDLGAPTSLAYAPNGDLVVFYPELPGVVVTHGTARQTITLPGDIGYDSGRALFHRQTLSGLACASCHPEGRDDGLVWEFKDMGMRRTQNLAGSILSRAPYHWTGDQADIPTLMDDVFAGRMSGAQPTRSEHLSLGPFLDRVPPPAPVAPVDAAAAARGQTLFESVDVGCIGCHAGRLMTTKVIVDVGTGGSFKVPSLLGVGSRAPFLHDGCAATLRDRFGPCGGDKHGATSTLTPAQLDDLTAYLDTL